MVIMATIGVACGGAKNPGAGVRDAREASVVSVIKFRYLR
jgi:hypothetical protein